MKRFLTGLVLILAVHLGGRFTVQGAVSPDQFIQSTAFLAGALTEFFTDSRTFTATTELTLQNGGDAGGRVVLRFGSAFDAGKMRLDLNLKSQLNEALGTGLPELGIDRVNFLLYPDHPARVVFPSQQSYVEVPLDQIASEKLKDAAGTVASRQIKKLVGSEPAVGVPARKYQLHADGAARTAYVWEAPGMKDMPVQIRVQAGGTIYNFAFRNIRQGPVDPRVFGIPANFKKQDSPVDIVKIGLAKMTEQLNAALPR